MRVPGRRTWQVTSMMVATLLLGGCDGPGVASPGSVRFGQVGSSDLSVAIVGTWRRAVYYVDDFGIARANETSWQFAGDGTVVRVLLARNITYGLADAQVNSGRYRIENGRLFIDFVTPTASQVSFDVKRSGNQLTIAGQVYLLVEP